MIPLSELEKLESVGYTFTTTGNVFVENTFYQCWNKAVRYVLSDTAFYILDAERVAYTYVAANVLTPLPQGLPASGPGQVTYRTIAAVSVVQATLYRLRAS